MQSHRPNLLDSHVYWLIYNLKCIWYVLDIKMHPPVIKCRGSVQNVIFAWTQQAFLPTPQSDCETQGCAWHVILLLPSSAGMLMITTAMVVTFIFVVGSLQFGETSQSHTCNERVWTEDWPWLSEILRVSWWSPACTPLSLISFTDVPERQKQNRK